jgi:hypothetical protein
MPTQASDLSPKEAETTLLGYRAQFTAIKERLELQGRKLKKNT